MSVHQLIDPLVALDNLLGTAPAPGGRLHFYERGTTTPKTTWQDFAQTVPNPNPVVLDAAGRLQAQVWGDGDYTVRFEAADGSAIVAAVEIRDPAPATSSLPDPTGRQGEYLTSDGTGFQWSGPWPQLPDPTGSAGMMVVVNAAGDGFQLQNQPEPYEPPEPDVSPGGAGYIQLGDVRVMWGSDSAPASGDKSTVKAVTFPAAFDEAPYYIGITPKLGTITTNGSLVCATCTNPATGGFTANFSLADDDNKSWKQIGVPVPFTWLAIGKRVPAS